MQVTRRSFSASLFATAILGFNSAGKTQDVASLRDTLRAGLKCRRDEEFEFVDRVVDFVFAGQLPTDLVLNTMVYAQKKRKNIPFPYFEAALKLQAEKLNVDL